jgi:type IV pilus modification protein PilV
MKFKSCKHHSGFTLIEVLIALVVAVVGILAMIQLSGAFLKTVSEAEQRTVAYAVAEQTLENLRSFDSLSGSTAGESYFDQISSSTATTTVSSGQSSYTFNIAWTIADNIVASGAITPGGSGAIHQTLKQVDVVVSWVQPDVGSVSLSSYIGGVDPNASALMDISNVGGSSPEVAYNPGVAPEVIAVDVADGKLKETTKPLPEVFNKNQSTQVRFETITFTDTNTEIQLIQEDFVTVNCRCVLDTTGGSITAPAYQKFEGADSPLIEVLGDTVSGATGTAASIGGGKVQSDFCDRCCANHHDTDSSTIKYSPLAGTASTGASNTLSHGVDHPHYKIVDDTTDPITLAEAVHGDEYLEACRFKRINGIYRLVKDWELREVNVFPSAYLTSGAVGSNLTGYVEYIKDAVKHYVFNDDIPAASVAGGVIASTAAPTLSPAPSLTLSTTGDDDSLSRSIYLDDILSVEGLAERDRKRVV